MNPVVLKLGGSVVTVKEEKLTPNNSAINRIAREIAQAGVEHLIIVHGGGSFGHPLAQEHRIIEGYISAVQRTGFAKTRQAMMRLNQLIINALLEHHLPAVAIQPSACLTTERGRIKRFYINPIRLLLRLGFIPVLYGDAVLDLKTGFTILSGDQLTSKLSLIFKAERAVISVDVDGLYREDPKTNPNSTHLTRISLMDLKSLLGGIGGAVTVDVTEGMRGKMTELIPALENGVQVQLVNAMVEKRLYKALKGERVIGTIINPR